MGRLDAERAKLGAQHELEVAERVLTRFGRPEAGERRKRRARAAQPAKAPSVSDAVLRAVHAHPEGASASEVLHHILREFGMTLRPNRLGIALERHLRAGRLEKWGSRWHSPRGGVSEANRTNISVRSV
jgi:hypothetical protein